MSKVAMLLRSAHVPFQHRSTTRGFTLLEVLVVVVMIGILSAIAAPGLLAFQNNQRLRAAQSEVFEALNQAKNTGTLKRVEYQISFRTQDEQVEWAVHPAANRAEGLNWNRLGQGIQIDSGNTTLYKKDGIYRMVFNHRGEAHGQLGQLVLSLGPQGKKRCIIVSNLLGKIRQGEFDDKTNSCVSQ